MFPFIFRMLLIYFYNCGILNCNCIAWLIKHVTLLFVRIIIFLVICWFFGREKYFCSLLGVDLFATYSFFFCRFLYLLHPLLCVIFFFQTFYLCRFCHFFTRLVSVDFIKTNTDSEICLAGESMVLSANPITSKELNVQALQKDGFKNIAVLNIINPILHNSREWKENK